ncbi:MAG TPA: ABC transporter permease [Blastocatellia bacterium]|nr:ABC transporter permease [Blastocatellia bacterium]
MGNLLQDLRYSVRVLLRQPGFTLIVVIALSLGIGANTAIFSAVNAVLLRPLPYDDPERLVWIWDQNIASGIQQEPVSFPNYSDYREQSQVFEDVAAFNRWRPVLTTDGEPERILAEQVSASLFSVLRVEASAGRTFLPEEDQPGKNNVVILSHGLWKRRFGSDKDVVGKTVTLNGNPHTVVGVMPSDFQHPAPDARRPIELWTPLGMDAGRMHRRLDFLNVIARLKPAASIEQARAEMGTISARLDQQYPETNAGWDTTVIPLHERFVGNVRPAMLVLLGAVAFLLLIACANVANLLLVRSTARQKEIAIRKALGATRGRLVRQFLTESLLLAMAGGLLGSLLAVLGIRILIALSPGNIPRIGEAGLDVRVLAFTLGLSLLTGVIFGLAPALEASNPDLNESLKEGGRNSGPGAGGGRLRSLLMIFEVSVALILMIGAGLMVKSFLRLQQVNPGFNPERVLTVELALPRLKYRENHQVLSFYKEVISRVENLPGVQAAAAVTSLPLGGGVSVLNIEIEGKPRPPSGHVIGAQSQVVSPSYFRAMGIPLLKGRLFTEQDVEDAPGVIVINDVMAERYWPGEDPVGKRISLVDAQTGPWLAVIGVVGNVYQVTLDAEPYPQMYEVYSQNPARGAALVVRTASDPTGMVASVRAQVSDIDRDQPLYNVRTMEQVLADSVSHQRFNMLLISVFSAVALVLAGVGIYGVISYSVSHRSHEIGIRMALGAMRVDILRMVIEHGLKLALVGVGIGLVAAFVLTRVMSSLLYGVSAIDPLTFAGGTIVLIGVAVMACYIPARRATKVDPMTALRYE